MSQGFGTPPQTAQSGSSAPRIVGTLGAAITTQTITFSGAEEVWLVGTAATATVTLASRAAGARLLILAVLDSVTRTITISDGASGTQAFTLPATASGATLGRIEVDCPNSTDVAAAVGTGSTSGAESDPNAILKSIIDAAGDLIVGTADNTAGRLAKGSDGQVLKMAAGAVTWSSDVGFANPMTTSGDIMYGGASGTPTRLAKGTDGQVLKLASGVPSWAADAIGGGGGGTSMALFRTGRYYCARITTPPSSDVITGNRLHVYPFFAGDAEAFDRIGVYITSASTANAKIRLGIYSDTGGGYPGALAVDTGQIDASTSGFKVATIAQTLTGWVWLAAVEQTTDALTSYVTKPDNEGLYLGPIGLPDPPAAFNVAQTMYLGSASGALPDPFTAAQSSFAIGSPLVFLRAA